MGMPCDTTTQLTTIFGYTRAERLYPYPPADEVLDYLAEYPITEVYGETYTSCMAMRRGDWIRLKRRAKSLPARPSVDPMIQIRDLIKGLMDVYTKPTPGKPQAPQTPQF